MPYPRLTPGLLTLGLFLCLGGVSIWQSTKAPIGDFGNYYYATKFWQEGTFDRGVYEPFVFNERVAAVSPEPLYLNYTPVPPLSVPAYLPFTAIGKVHTAKLVFGLLGLVLFLVTLYRVITFFKLERNPWLLALPLIFFTPFRNNFWQGQSYLYLTAFLLEGVVQWKKKTTHFRRHPLGFTNGFENISSDFAAFPVDKEGAKMVADHRNNSRLPFFSTGFVLTRWGYCPLFL